MSEPESESAASKGGHGHMRVSRADRERTVDVLKAAFVYERLTEDELDDRIGRALAARVYADLDALTADIPAVPGPDVSPAPVAAPARRPGSPVRNRSAVRAVKIGAIGVAAVIVPISVVTGVLVNPAAAVVLAALFSFLAAVAAGLVGAAIAVALKLESRQRNRSHGNAPPGSGPARAVRRPGGRARPSGDDVTAFRRWRRDNRDDTPWMARREQPAGPVVLRAGHATS